MRYFTALCLSAAVVFGAAISSPSATFGCGGGSSGQTGCKVATAPLTVDAVVSVLRWLNLVIP